MYFTDPMPLCLSDFKNTSTDSVTEAYAIFVRPGQKELIELLQHSQHLSMLQLIQELQPLKIESNEIPPEFCDCKEVSPLLTH